MAFVKSENDKKELKARLKGVSVAVLTPLTRSGDLDESGLRKNIKFLIGSGIKEGQGFLLLLGTTGEFPNFSREEMQRVIKLGVEECKGKVPLVIGANHSNNKDAIELGQFAASEGADAILVRPTYYWGIPSEEMILRHYSEIAKEVPLGIIVYNRCLSNVVDLPIETIKRLADMERVVAIKDGTPIFTKFDKTIKEVTGKISCINGWGEVYEPYTLLMGSDGFLSMIGNLIPEFAMKLFSLARSGNFLGAEEVHRQLMPLFNILFAGPYGSFIELMKSAMHVRGLAGGPVRDPLPKSSAELKSSVQRSVENLISALGNKK